MMPLSKSLPLLTPQAFTASALDPLLEPIAAMCRTQISIIDRVVEAGVHGDKQAALQATACSTRHLSVSQAQGILDELIRSLKTSCHNSSNQIVTAPTL